MKWIAAVVGIVLAGAVAAFWLLDVGTAGMVVFAAIAAGFFGSLPWVIGGVMDLSRTGGDLGTARVVKFDDETPGTDR